MSSMKRIYEKILGEHFSSLRQMAFLSGPRQAGKTTLGEAILSTKWHSPEETGLVEAYLRKKWFGQETEGFREASVGTLKVASGARVEVLGGGAVTVGAIKGSGTVACDVKFAPGGNIDVVVNDDGSVPCVSTSGAADLTSGGTVNVSGNLAALAPGEYPILSAESISWNSSWSVVSSNGRYRFSLRVSDGVLNLCVTANGMMLIVK